MEKNREVELAVSALTAELLKLSPLSGAERMAVCITIENALSRLTEAILAQSHESQAEFHPTLVPTS